MRTWNARLDFGIHPSDGLHESDASLEHARWKSVARENGQRIDCIRNVERKRPTKPNAGLMRGDTPAHFSNERADLRHVPTMVRPWAMGRTTTPSTSFSTTSSSSKLHFGPSTNM